MRGSSGEGPARSLEQDDNPQAKLAPPGRPGLATLVTLSAEWGKTVGSGYKAMILSPGKYSENTGGGPL